MLELETAVTHGAHYDPDAPEPLRLSRRKLRSGLVAPATNYAIATAKHGSLYLVPLKTTLQMRPDLSHVDLRRDLDKTPKLQQVSGQPQKSSREVAVQLSSYAHKRAQQENEAWRQLDVHQVDSEVADGARDWLTDLQPQYALRCTSPEHAIVMDDEAGDG